MARGRRKNPEPIVKVNLSIRKSTIVGLDQYLKDPLRDKRQYGEISKLVDRLLRDHLREVAGINLDDMLEENKQ